MLEKTKKKKEKKTHTVFKYEPKYFSHQIWRNLHTSNRNQQNKKKKKQDEEKK